MTKYVTWMESWTGRSMYAPEVWQAAVEQAGGFPLPEKVQEALEQASRDGKNPLEAVSAIGEEDHGDAT